MPTLVLLMLPTLLVAMDMTALILALPHLSADLGASAVQQLWISDSYGLMVAGMVITMGTLGDRIGHRRLLLTGASAFAVLSVVAAFSVDPLMLIVVRALLGVAGATLAPSTLALITNMFPDDRARGRAAPDGRPRRGHPAGPDDRRRGAGLRRRSPVRPRHRPGRRQRSAGACRKRGLDVRDGQLLRRLPGAGSDGGDRRSRLPGPYARHLRLLGSRARRARRERPAAQAAATLHTAREAFTASLHVTGIVAAVIFAALAVMVFAMRPAQPGPEPHAEPRPYTRSEPQSHEAERQELPAGSALAEPVPASH